MIKYKKPSEGEVNFAMNTVMSRFFTHLEDCESGANATRKSIFNSEFIAMIADSLTLKRKREARG